MNTRLQPFVPVSYFQRSRIRESSRYFVFPFIFRARSIVVGNSVYLSVAVIMQTWRRWYWFKEQRRVFIPTLLRQILIATGDNKTRDGQCWHKAKLPEGRGAINVEDSGRDGCLFTWRVTYDRLAGRRKSIFSTKIGDQRVSMMNPARRNPCFLLFNIYISMCWGKKRLNTLSCWNDN